MNKPVTLYANLAALAVVSFLAMNWVYDYVLVFQSDTNDCFFLFGEEFFLTFFDHPAGLLRYAGRFLGQFYFYPWVGAVIVSAVITCFGVVFHHILAKLNREVHLAQAILPGILLLVLHTSTVYLAQDTLGLCAGGAAFLGYLYIRGPVLRRLYALAITVILYFLLGVYFCLFVVWVQGVEWLDRPWRSGLLFRIGHLALSIAVPFAAWRWLYPIPLQSAWACPILFGPPFRSGNMPYTLAGLTAECIFSVLLLGSILLIPFWDRLFSRPSLASFWRIPPGRRSRITLAVATAMLALLVHLIRYDRVFSNVMACQQLYRQGRWGAVLKEAGDNPDGELHVQFVTNFALCHQGKLLDEMFHYPQTWGTRGLVLNMAGMEGLDPNDDDTSWAMYNSDLFYEMGHINASFRHAYNLWALAERYEPLKRMAQCSMVNGNDALAAKYIRLLEKSLFYRGWARRYQAILADPDAAEQEFAEIRGRLPASDGIMYKHPTVPLYSLLETRPDNRMAFDYLMAWLLLDKTKLSLAVLSGSSAAFKKAGYASLPVHCQEAMLLVERGENRAIDRSGYRYSPEVVTCVDRFIQDLASHSRQPDAGAWIRSRYGKTYPYYYFLIRTPRENRPSTQPQTGYDGASRQE